MIKLSKAFIQQLFKLEVVEQALGLKRSKVIRYSVNFPPLSDIRSVFKQTPEEDQELIDFYSKAINDSMDKKAKAQSLARMVNNRLTYISDQDLYGRLEVWKRPIEIHNKRLDDCDGYAVLLCYLLRLFGFSEFEAFVRAGYCYLDDNQLYGHATCYVADIETLQFYPLEGSLYASRTNRRFWSIPVQEQKIYSGSTWFLTNDKLSYSETPWLRFVK